MLRQQADHADSRPNRSLADFVAPVETGLHDHVGAFAVAIHGARRWPTGSRRSSTTTARSWSARSPTVWRRPSPSAARGRAASVVRAIRGAHAGDRIGERFRGIRPAYGYPACPDHSEKGRLLELLGAEQAGIGLTESYATTPAASVSGLYFGTRRRGTSRSDGSGSTRSPTTPTQGHRGRGGRALATSEPRVRAAVIRTLRDMRALLLCVVVGLAAAGCCGRPSRSAAADPCGGSEARRVHHAAQGRPPEWLRPSVRRISSRISRAARSTSPISRSAGRRSRRTGPGTTRSSDRPPRSTSRLPTRVVGDAVRARPV